MSGKRLDLASHLESQGVEEIVGGNTPFLLKGSENVWLVCSGKVEVFSVGVKEDGHTGTRAHFLTALPGDALFGMNLEAGRNGIGFLAVGVIGTRLLKLNISHLQEAFRSGHADMVADTIDRWIAGISAGVSKKIRPKPRADLTLEGGGQGELRDGERLRAQKGVIWIRHLEGESLFIGMKEVGGTASDCIFPITDETFLQAMGPVRLSSVGTDEALRDGGWAGLDAFYAAVSSCQLHNVGLERADELNRLKEKAQRDRRILSSAVSGLVSILEGGRRYPAPTESDDPLVVAVKRIGDRMGFAIKVPETRRDGTESPDALAEIEHVSRFRTRKIILKGEWWKEETGPLLAFVEKGHRPVAIWACGPGKFELYDPSDDTLTELTSESAAELEPMAHTFYRPLPDGKLSAWQIFRFGLKDNTRDLARPFLVALIASLLALLPPYFAGILVETVIPEAARHRLVELAVVLGVIAITTTLLGIVRNISVLRVQTKMSASVQPAIWDRLLNLSLAFFRRHVAGDLVLRVNAIEQIRQVLSGVTVATLMSGLFSLLYIGQLLYYSRKMALWAILLALVLLAVVGLSTFLKLRIQRELMHTQGGISGLVLQFLGGISKLRVAGAEGRAFAEWARKFEEQKRLALRAGSIDASLAVFNAGFPVVASMAIFYSMIYFLERAGASGEVPMSIGDFVVFNTAFGMLLTQMIEFGTAGLSVLAVVPLFERARPILEADKEVDDTKADVGELNGHIEVSHVSFRYHEGEPLVLDDVSIEVPAGKFIALVGPSGSGKSTLLRLMLGLEAPENGAVYFDGRDISQLDVQQLRRQIGVVIQNGRIRPGSIYDNIVGSRPLGISDAWKAARMAGLEQDIREMPMGMHTLLQQGGSALSGGQRQRLMIARAVVLGPRILFFDEATSALDNRTQAVVSESLRELQATRVAIAHRLSTIVGADWIYVLVGGRVVQAGTYVDLMGQGGVFKELVERQIL